MTNQAVTILSKGEIPRLSGVTSRLSLCKFQDIYLVEQYEFLKCFGLDFKDDLLANAIDYTAVIQWVQGTEYTLGTSVIYNSEFKIADVTTTSEPNGADWSYSPKFAESLYEQLWCRYLGAYLSLGVIRNNLPNMTIKVTEQGIVKQFGENFEQATDKQVKSLQVSYDRKIAQLITLMDHFMVNNNSTDVFDNYKGINSAVCDECGQTGCAGSCVSSKRQRNRYQVY